MATLTPDNLSRPFVDNSTDENPAVRPDLVLGDNDYTSVTDKVADIALAPIKKTTKSWWIAFFISVHALGFLQLCILYLILTGVGIWGNNNPTMWGFPIVNFVFWVGIGHAGTLISAILYLFRQNWRTSINRFAEAMTIFAVMCAGLFPGIHVGRAWLAYWLFPYPNQMGMWPQFRSPLLWDVFAVSTYATVSTLFWYVGMVPDLATLRDRSTNKWRRMIYGIASLGWTGSARHWHRFEKTYLLLAAIATPLVLSVHSVVSFDFAVSQLPGWHTTIFPPYFVCGAIFGGFAMVLVLAIPAREWFGLRELITNRHVDNMAKILLATGMIVTLAYLTEIFISWYGAAQYEMFAFQNRIVPEPGNYWWAFWIMFGCNSIIPLVLWFRKIRQNMWLLWLVAVAVNVGMWFERFVIILSLPRDFVPGSWGHFMPTWVDGAMLAASFGLFFTFFLLFCRFLPMVAVAEVKSVMPRPNVMHRIDTDGEDAEPEGDAEPAKESNDG